MRILFIGNENIQNEAILEILRSQRDFEVNQLYSIQVEEQALEPNSHKYDISLVDLASFPYSPDVGIALVKNNNLADYIIAMHTYTSDKLIEPILKAGADYYLSMDSGANELLDTIKRLKAFSK